MKGRTRGILTSDVALQGMGPFTSPGYRALAASGAPWGRSAPYGTGRPIDGLGRAPPSAAAIPLDDADDAQWCAVLFELQFVFYGPDYFEDGTDHAHPSSGHLAVSRRYLRQLNQVLKGQRTLNEHVNEGNTEIAQRLNETFQTMGQRTPIVAVLSDQAPSLLMAPFSGSGDQGMHLSFWLRQLEDLLHIRPVPPTDEQKAYFLIAHLSGTPAEVLSPSETGRVQAGAHGNDYSFRGPSQDFGKISYGRTRYRTQNELALAEFVSRLRGDIRSFVRMHNPTTLDEALEKARLVEQVLTEAAADRLLHSAQPIVEVHALDHGHSPRRPEFDHAYQRPEQVRRYRPQTNNQRVTFQSQGGNQRRSFRQEAPRRSDQCYNCGGTGHFSRQCPSPPVGPRRDNRSTGRSPNFRERSNQQSYGPRQNARMMPCVPTAPPTKQVRLDDATERLQELSLAVDRTKSELEQSKAQIAALRQRNEELASSAFRTNPTLTMRNLLGRQDVDATHLGNGFVQIRRCIPLPMAAIRLLPFNSSCFEYPRVELSLPSGSKWQAFLNSATGVISSAAPAADCASTSPFYLLANGSLISEIAANNQLQEMWIAAEHERLIDHVTPMDTPRTRTDTALSQIFTFVVKELPLPIPPTPEPPLEIAVRAAETVILQPGSETMVLCYVADVSRNLGPMMSLGNVLNSEAVFVAPAVFRSVEPRLLLSNPSPAVQVVYKDQRLATAEPLQVAQDGSLVEIQPCF
ncbi:unnamed protein product [Heligmosomoides polygyrus]|uniref:CCHC-type domain-containing protein n=1 Tax=Heligmosomoides polygyrus TaxID=6339 RepID=A0A183GG89_HELPZ|nr:unnamed protein product [Heligmosomoides polygyrus]